MLSPSLATVAKVYFGYHSQSRGQEEQRDQQTNERKLREDLSPARAVRYGALCFKSIENMHRTEKFIPSREQH